MPPFRRLFHVVLIVVLGVQVAAQPQAQPTDFSIEQILSAPFPTNLVAAPTGGRVAWVINARGVRNIWVADAPAYEGRALTAHTEDDDQDIAALSWTPDGETLVYVRGGGPNREGELPNPASDPTGVEQAIWALALDGADSRRLSDGTSPTVSPRGNQVAFIRNGSVWSVPLDATEAASQLIKGRGRAGTLRWSPDGSQLAFVSSRGDHSFIGVYDVSRPTVRYLDPSVDRDASPVWSHDGSRIAFIRTPASRALFMFGPRREAEPWSIRVASVADGRGREVWKAAPGAGSVPSPIVGVDQLQWGAGDHLVFPWERDGWRHLYSVPVGGGSVTLLTPGVFEVEHVTLSPDRAAVIYSSNQDDLLRRHIWRVAIDGGAPVAVTSGDGIEWAPAPVGGDVAFLSSDALRPAHPAVAIDGGAPRALAPGTLPSDFPVDVLVEPQPVTFPAADGMSIPGQLFLPSDLAPGDRRPAVVFFHGGSRRQMLLGWHYMGYYHNTYALNQFLANRGYVVLSVNYRSGTGYGMEFREALNYGAHGASEFHDVLGAGLYLASRSDVDPTRIGLWGGSYGGYLTALGLARASDLFAVGVDIHGVHDWNVVIRNFAPTYDPLERQQTARLEFESSPMADVETWRSPVLLIHGDDDRNVPFSETVDLVEALRRQGVEFEQIVFPDEVHGFLRHANWVRAFTATADFFDRQFTLGRSSSTASSR